MAARLKTKDVEVFLPEGQTGTQPSVSRRVNIQPGNSQTAYERFGVEVEDCQILFDDAEAAEYYQTGGRVVHGEIAYSIKSDPRVWDTVPATSHVEVLLVRVR